MYRWGRWQIALASLAAFLTIAVVGLRLAAMFAPPVQVSVKLQVAGVTPYDPVYLPLPDAEVMIVRVRLRSWEGTSWHGRSGACLHRAFYRTDAAGRVSAPIWWADFGDRVMSTNTQAHVPGYKNLEPEEAKWANQGPNVIVLRPLRTGERAEVRSERFTAGRYGCEVPLQSY